MKYINYKRKDAYPKVQETNGKGRNINNEIEEITEKTIHVYNTYL